MAVKTHTVVYDDIDGTEGAEPVHFTVDGTEYRIDLNDKNREKLSKALAPFIENATRVGGRRSSGRSRSKNTDLSAIREWARANGYQVSDRGRIKEDIREAWEAAGSPR